MDDKINNDNREDVKSICEIREQKIKFIEILLIVGGLIGSSWVKDGDPVMNRIFGVFLIGALFYYFLANTPNKYNRYGIDLFTVIIAVTFSIIAILPLKSLDTAAILLVLSQNTINTILFILIAAFIAINLYFPRRYLS